MNLIIDIGNSQVKIAIFNNRKILKSMTIDEINSKMVLELKSLYPELTQAILCSVGEVDGQLLEFLKKEFELFIVLNHQTNIPIENLYESKESLGPDRIAAAVGANHLFPDSDLLVIDAGTAIT